MMICAWDRPHTGLLVSVRNSVEAIEALSGGAEVIDVKEPNRGPLGAADGETIADVIRTVGGRVPVTAAMGELADYPESNPSTRLAIPLGVSLYKVGLAGCRDVANWSLRWRRTNVASSPDQSAARPVAVVYADWRAAHAPEPEEVLALAVDNGCPVLLIDTWNKSAGSLFDYWPSSRLEVFMDRVRSERVAVVLAGSLAGPNFDLALKLRPDLVAVRTAACEGGRHGTVQADRVRRLRLAAAAVNR
jgi:uncharacterized protein (UPF0264 family)